MLRHRVLIRLSLILTLTACIMMTGCNVDGRSVTINKYTFQFVTGAHEDYVIRGGEFSLTAGQMRLLLSGVRDGYEAALTSNIWDMQLASYGREVSQYRREFIGELSELIRPIHQKLSGGKEELVIQYEPNTEADQLEAAVKKSREADRKQKTTLVGPHRDDLSFYVNGIDIRRFGSQGQQRTAALSLKLAEIELVKKIKKEYPILLLDDVLSELDGKRQDHLLASIRHIQTIITCTGLDDFISHSFQIDKTFRVVSGTVTCERPNKTTSQT